MIRFILGVLIGVILALLVISEHSVDYKREIPIVEDTLIIDTIEVDSSYFNYYLIFNNRILGFHTLEDLDEYEIQYYK